MGHGGALWLNHPYQSIIQFRAPSFFRLALSLRAYSPNTTVAARKTHNIKHYLHSSRPSKKVRIGEHEKRLRQAWKSFVQLILAKHNTAQNSTLTTTYKSTFITVVAGQSIVASIFRRWRRGGALGLRESAVNIKNVRIRSYPSSYSCGYIISHDRSLSHVSMNAEYW